jgi:hypothetical protein
LKRLFWDVETAPNIMFSWRAGFKINLDHDNIIKERAIICICYKWEDSPEVHALSWDKGDDRQLIEDFAQIANRADELVAHNGDKFDIPWFNGRNLIHGLSPIPEYKTVDTCAIARRTFYLNSNKLDYLAKVLLGEGKIKTDFDLWKKICLHNDEDAMRKMVEYCRKDVALLQRVWERLAPYYKPKTHAGVMEGGDRWTCPSCGAETVAKTKTRITPLGMKQHQMQCRGCGKYYTISDLVFRQYVVAKYGEAVEERTPA